jgi:small subunit ribosomal protein S20
MANTKSAQKHAKQNPKRRQKNLARKTAMKTAVKKVLAALHAGDVTQAQTLLRDAEAKMARAGNKSVLHKKTAQRRTGRLAHKVAEAIKNVKKA